MHRVSSIDLKVFVCRELTLSINNFCPCLTTATVYFDYGAITPYSRVETEKTKIYKYYDHIFETIGLNVVLPCKASSNASINWVSNVDNNNKSITGEEPRYK